MLKIENLHVFYGGIHALKGIRLNVAEEKIAALIGANGAGKSTLLRTICGLSRAAQGTIKFLGSPIENLPTHRIIQSGVAMVPEGRKVFVDLSIRENLLMGAFNREDHLEVRNDIDWLYTLFPRLQERASQPAGTLSGGEQQMSKKMWKPFTSSDVLLAIETRLAKASLTMTEQRDPQNLNHPTDVTRFQKELTHFSLADYVSAAHAPAVGKANDMEPKFFAEFNALVADTPVAQIQDLSALAPAARLCGNQLAGELRPGELELLRAHAQRRGEAAGTLEALHPARGSGAGRGAGPGLRGALLPARRKAAHPRHDPGYRAGHGQGHRRAGLDERRNQNPRRHGSVISRSVPMLGFIGAKRKWRSFVGPA